METLNRAIDDVATFNNMLQKLTHPPKQPIAPAVAAWNAEVDRKKAERRKRRELEREIDRERERAHQELKA
ncbi:MAG TPA: hypothetical protein PLN55_14375 [Burkholderiaceae bacterium]|nr:hypothetical protein [Burkholderiaceae bacterium]